MFEQLIKQQITSVYLITIIKNKNIHYAIKN